MRRSAGERSVGTQDTSVAHLWFTSRMCHHETARGEPHSCGPLMAAKPANVSAAGNRRRVLPPLSGLNSTGTSQAASGTISLLMEDHAHCGWLCALVTGANDTMLRGNEIVGLLVDTGATEYVCGPLDITNVERTTATVNGRKTEHNLFEIAVFFFVVEISFWSAQGSVLRDREEATQQEKGKHRGWQENGNTLKMKQNTLEQ